jgi:serine/threonine protein kinase
MERHVDLAGKYRLIAELGQGGMATVYLAVSIGKSGFRKLAVVKLIRPQFASDPDLIEMFLDEARLSARLNHPNVVQTYDVGVDDHRHFMAMEYLDGVSFNAAISRLTRQSGPVGFELRARVLLGVLEGLRYAHDLKDYDGTPLKIVHRDVTPHNIFVTYDGQVKLLDFGIAKAATSSVQTATGVIKGKLTYMAPEQALGDPVDGRADIYSVGVMLWEALTGRRRFPADLSDVAMFTRAATGEVPEAPSAASLGLPEEIDGILRRALAPKREERFQTAGELHAELEAVLRKAGPASLRDLGTMLATAFGRERQKIGQVIEEQFRLMDSGRPTAAEAGELPTVHPPRGTDSRIEAIEPAESTTTKGVSTIASSPTPDRKRSRFALWGVAAASAVALAATVGPLVISHPKVEPGVPGALSAAGDAGHGSSTANADPQAEERSNTNVAVAPRVGVGDVSQSQASGRHDESTDPSSSRTGVSALHHDHGRTSGTAHETPDPNASADAGLAPASGDPPPFRTTTTKPKVRLERDNPWP